MEKSEQESETHKQYEVRWKMDKDASGARHGGEISYGVRTSDGDGTVPLISTGVMCQKHWREEQLNPHGIRVVSREYPHEPVAPYRDLRCSYTSLLPPSQLVTALRVFCMFCSVHKRRIATYMH